MRRAGQAKADLPESTSSMFEVLQSYVQESYPGCWPDVERLSRSAAPIPLPEIPEIAYQLALYGRCPKWGEPGVPRKDRQGRSIRGEWAVKPKGWWHWYETTYVASLSAS